MPECSVSQKDCIMESPAQVFLEMHMSKIIGRTGSPMELADYLRGKSDISKEMYNNIRAQKTDQDKMREIYNNLNNIKAFECVYEWLKEKEPHLIDELENNSDKENGAPERKRLRSQTDEAMDETNSVNKSLDLKTLNTFAKLEDWVSDPIIIQNLIDNLKKKLEQGEMDALKKDLKDKKLRSSLRINAKDFHNIKSNRDLQSFLEAATGAKFPRKLTLNMFFEKDSEYVSLANDSLIITERYTADESRGSSRYEAQSRLNLKSNQSHVRNVPPSQNNPVNNNIGDTEVQSSQKIPGESPLKTVHVFQNDLLWPKDDSPEETNGVPSSSKQKTVQFPSPSSCRTPSKDPKKNKTNRSHKQITKKLKKKKQRDILLHNWARKKCNNGNKEEIKKVLDCTSIKNIAEHSEYPFLLAEKLRVYDNKETGERQIIVFHDEENNSSKTRTLIHYQMFVCGIKKTVILGQKEQEINFDTSNVPVDRCLKFILEAFVPALAVYKNMQREELYYLP